MKVLCGQEEISFLNSKQMVGFPVATVLQTVKYGEKYITNISLTIVCSKYKSCHDMQQA